MHDPNIQNAPQQVVSVFRQFTTLVQDEMALARAEIAKNLSRAGFGIAMICVSALLALVALNVLATALVGALAANGMPFWLAALIVGGVLILIACLLGIAGKTRLEPEALKPKRTIKSLKEDIEHIKESSNG